MKRISPDSVQLADILFPNQQGRIPKITHPQGYTSPAMASNKPVFYQPPIMPKAPEAAVYSEAAEQAAASINVVSSSGKPVISGLGTVVTSDVESIIPGVDPATALRDVAESIEQLKVRLAETKQALQEWSEDTQAHFTRWFGSATEESRHIITERVNATAEALNGLTVDNFKPAEELHDQEGLYAYVYPDDDSTIYLGQEFGNAPLTGTDSKMGTLAHEISHFTSVGSTDDHEYGEHDSEELAQTEPNKALYNADSFQYFIEGISDE